VATGSCHAKCNVFSSEAVYFWLLAVIGVQKPTALPQFVTTLKVRPSSGVPMGSADCNYNAIQLFPLSSPALLTPFGKPLYTSEDGQMGGLPVCIQSPLQSKMTSGMEK
jgi:hypothetical protein